MHHVRSDKDGTDVRVLLGSEGGHLRQGEAQVHQLVDPIQHSVVLVNVGSTVKGEADWEIIMCFLWAEGDITTHPIQGDTARGAV